MRCWQLGSSLSTDVRGGAELAENLRASVTNPTVYNRSIYKYNLIDVYKYNHMLS